MAVARQAPRAATQAFAARSVQRSVSHMNVTRAFATTASGKISKVVQAEIKHEEENYEQSKDIKAFLSNSKFKFIDTAGDVNMALEKALGEKTVRIEWQLTNPFDPNMDEEGGEGGPDMEATDMMITVQDKSGGGLVFYCATQSGEDHRFVIGNVKTFASDVEKDNVTSYNGPEFEDLDDKLQEAFDEYLAELGLNSEICDFIDAMAVDKEQREYVRWLKTAQKIVGE